MKLSQNTDFYRISLSALLVGGLLIVFTATGCGDDDDGAAGSGAAGVAGSTAGSGGSGASSGVEAGGTGGETGGSGGGVEDAGAGTGGSGGETATEPKTVDECKELYDVPKDEPDCHCDECSDVFGPCLVDQGCMIIVDCAMRFGCSGSECNTDPLCSDTISRYPASAGLAAEVSTCFAENCPEATDGGIPDGGIPDSGE